MGTTYQQAGVDIDAGNTLVENISSLAKRTRRPEVLTGLGGFGGLFQVDLNRFPEPVLVAGTDGVGTKLLLAREYDRLEGLGQDLVAMCANDVVTTGAEPAFFLDYYATGELEVASATQVVAGIAKACEACEMSLLGGETAELPGMYAAGEFDLAGFCVGVVNRDSLIDGATVRPGDVIIGLASDGVHSNGFSLVRMILRDRPELAAKRVGARSLIEALLTPTRLYPPILKPLLGKLPVKALAHVTGGGLVENPIRAITDPTLGIDIRLDALPPLFEELAKAGNVAPEEMLRVFNCGVGMCVFVAREHVDEWLSALQPHGASVIGTVRKAGNERVRVRFG